MQNNSSMTAKTAARKKENDYSVVGKAVVQLAHRYADAGVESVLIVDECPDRIHAQLGGP